MELKSYQHKVMRDLTDFLDAVNITGDLGQGWKAYWENRDIMVGFNGVPFYQNKIKHIPHICTKVPTGGGKTYMGCCAVRRVFDRLPSGQLKVVVWLVPSDAILTQTVRVLSDVNHPYRQRLDRDFGGRVGVYTKEMLLNGQNFSPDTVREQLTVCVMSYASLRIDSKKKDVRKVYQENGNLYRFAEFFKDKSVLLADTPDTALIQVLRCMSPIVIVDESHNAGSTLSAEMLENLNPSFVLELTATPRSSSNIISYVDARELKKENMVKLPVIVFNRSTRQTVIQDAIQLRGNLEKEAILAQEAGGPYIRPIVLFQAQPKISEDNETFEKVRQMLIDMGIPRNQIAVKTSKVDDIKNTDLLGPDCEIRYIITVNALKEGWDCPFAYILASLANKTSKVDVEQILGRILRQPYARKQKSNLLNLSYVLTCSADFHSTLDEIVKALNKCGFSRKDYRIVEECAIPAESALQTKGEQLPIPEPNQPEPGQLQDDDDFTDIHPEEVRDSMNRQDGGADSTGLSEMIQTADAQAQKYEEEISDPMNDVFTGGEMGEMLHQNTIQPQFKDEVKELRIPQFFLRSTPDFFGGEYELLEQENLSEGFTLSGQDANVSFELATGEMYQVDIASAGEAVLKARMVLREESEHIQKYLESIPTEKRISSCATMIAHSVNKNDRYSENDVKEYVKRVVANMTDDELSVMETAIPTYARKIQDKLDRLEETYRAKQFEKWLDSGKIVCLESWQFPQVITPAFTIDSIPNSLYEAEKDDMNQFERKVVDVMVGTGNIRWWHRVIEKNDFRLNGYFNHYPDFIVMSNSRKLLLIEAKGDYLDGDDSKAKLALGRKWQEALGQKYRYFMVFDKKDLGIPGAYTLDRFAEVMREI